MLVYAAWCTDLGIGPWIRPLMIIPARQCTYSIASDDIGVIWDWYRYAAWYVGWAGHAGMWAFNHAQICPLGCTYNSRRLDMSIVGLMETWISWAGSRAIFGNVHIWALFRIYLLHSRPMSICVHRSFRLCINAHLRTLELGNRPYRFISGLSL